MLGEPPTEVIPRDSGAPELSVIVVTYRTPEMTLVCLDHLCRSAGVRFEVLLVDNGSQDDTVARARAAHPALRILANPVNLGFAAAVNQAAALASGRWIVLLNSDTEIFPGCLADLVAFARARPGHGIYGGVSVFADGTVNGKYAWRRPTPWSVLAWALGLGILGRGSRIFDPEAVGTALPMTSRRADIISGAMMMIDAAVWRRLGGLDERFFMYGEDADLCYRARKAGYQPVVVASARLVHRNEGSMRDPAEFRMQMLCGRTTLLLRYWPLPQRWLARPLMLLGVGLRMGAAGVAAQVGLPGMAARAALWRRVWAGRGSWSRGYDRGSGQGGRRRDALRPHSRGQ